MNLAALKPPTKRKRTLARRRQVLVEANAGLNAEEAQNVAVTLRDQIREVCLEEGTCDLEKQLAQAVSFYTDPDARIAEIDAGGPYAGEAESELMRRERNALTRLRDSVTLTQGALDMQTSSALVISALRRGEDIDLPTAINELVEQARNLDRSDKEGIKRLLAQQAVLAHHVGQHTIQQASRCPTVEGTGKTAGYGVKMLQDSAMIAERLAKLEEGPSQRIFARQANVSGGHQQVVNEKTRQETKLS